MPGESAEDSTESPLDAIFYQRDRVRFIERRGISGARATVALVGVMTILTFVTGLSTLSQEEIVLDGPLAAVIPEVETIVRFGGVLGAFLLGVLTVGLQRRKRIAVSASLLLVPLVGLLPLLTLQSTHMPVLVLALLVVPLLVLNRSQFHEALNLTSLQIAALLSIFGVLSYGAIGSYALRDQFRDLETVSDAIYYVLVTIATVGYGDITPISSQAKWFSLSIIILGTGAFTAAIGALIVPAIEKRMANAFGTMTQSNLSLLEDHVVILGYSEITDGVLEELAQETDVVVVTEQPDVAADLDQANVNVLTADPTKRETLKDVGIEYARGVVVGTDNDPRDVLAVIGTRKLAPDVRIVAAATEPHNADTLKDVGADQVISPTEIGGKLLGRSVLETLDTHQILSDMPIVEDEPAASSQESDPSAAADRS